MRRLIVSLLLLFLTLPALAGVGRTTYDPDAAKFFAQQAANSCTAGTQQWKAAINTLVSGLKTDGIWTTFDALYVWVTPDTCSGRINLVAPTLKNLTINGTPTFVAYGSITGNATDAWLDTGVTISGFSKFTQNAGHLGGWTVSHDAPSNNAIWATATSNRTLLSPYFNGNALFRVNTATTVTDTGLGANMYYAADRTDASTVSSYTNGTVRSSAVVNASAAPSGNFGLFQWNSSFGGAGLLEADIGSALDATQEANLHTRLLVFMRAMGISGVQ